MKTEEKYTSFHVGPETEGSSPELCSCTPFSGSVEASKSIRFPQQIVTDEGIEIWIQPVRPDDVALLKSLFESLSPESIYFRFFSPLKQIPDHMLDRITDIDVDCEITLVAMDRFGRMLGICCVDIMEGGIRGEFAVLIGDHWQGKGIGAELLKHCLILGRIIHPMVALNMTLNRYRLDGEPCSHWLILDTGFWILDVYGFHS